MAGKRIKFREMKSTELIGIMGTAHGVGTTHFCCMLGVFFAIVKGYRIAIVEANDTGCFRQAGIILSTFKHKISKIISIYTQSDISELSRIVSMGYDYVIVDYGCDFNAAKESFLMCPRKIIVGSTVWWKFHSYVAFLVATKKERSSDRWIFTTTNPNRKLIKYLEKEFHKDIISIPYEPDPFFLKDSINFWHHLTEKIL